ncbi:MAG: OmpA family protein [Alteromonadales bacterium]|nr:OmpA family protein [Alteromonadales bacterium]
MKKLVLGLSVVIALSGCQATQRQNATTGEYETNSATKGAVLGAVLGALGGIASGDNAKERRKRALIGATGGAVVGGGIGYYFDQQEKALREQLVNSGVQVERIGDDQLVLRMEKGIGFESGSYALEYGVHNTLRSIARILVEYPKTQLMIEGHTDSTGSKASNQTLSERRADSVRSFLISQDVATNRVAAKGSGELHPIRNNKLASGRAYNRRVEIKIQPL